MTDAPVPKPSRPYPGLRPYSYKDSAIFFGRADQSFALYRLIDSSSFVAVVGSSGSGKSSLVLAGLLPLLAAERAQGGRQWRWETMVPGDDPIAALAALLTKLSNDRDADIAAERRRRIEYQLRRSSFGLVDALREVDGFEGRTLLLVIDQFEEIFRLAAPDASVPPLEAELGRDEAMRFVQILLEANRDPKVDVRIVITMRSDFIGDCARFHGLPEAVSRHQYLVPALTRDQLEQAIVGPLKPFGASIEPELVERLLNDCTDDMDQLPVLQHALLRLWEFAGERLGQAGEGEAPRRLTPVDYVAVGKLGGALSQHANALLAHLKEAEVEAVFRALSRIDAEQRIVRRSLKLRQLQAETGIEGASLKAILHPFRADECSFILPLISKTADLQDETRVQVGHEALLRRWEKVSGGLAVPGGEPGWCRAEDRDGQTYRFLLFNLDSGAHTLPLDTVEERAKWWRERARPPAWAERYGGRRDKVEALIADSEAALREQERKQAEEQRRQADAVAAALKRRRRQVVTGAVGGAITFVGVLAGLAFVKYYDDRIHQADVANLRVKAVTQAAQQIVEKVSTLYGQNVVTAKGAQDLLKSAVNIVESIDIASSKNGYDAIELTVEGRRAKIVYLLAVCDLAQTLRDYKTANNGATRALENVEPLIAASPKNWEAHYLALLAALRMGVNRMYLPDLPDHEKVTTEAFDRAKSEAETIAMVDWPNKVEAQKLLSDVIFQYGAWQETLKRAGAATLMYQQSLDLLKPLVSDEGAHPSLGLRGAWASALQRVGRDALKNADPVTARSDLSEAYRVRLRLVSDSEGDAYHDVYVSNLISSYSDLADLAWADKQWRQALVNRANAVEEETKLFRKDPTNTWREATLSKYILDEIEDLKRSLDEADASEGERSQALERLKKDFTSVLDIQAELADRDPTKPDRRRALAFSQTNFGDFLAQQKLNVEATEIYKKALQTWDKIRTAQPDCCATFQTDLARKITDLGAAKL